MVLKKSGGAHTFLRASGEPHRPRFSRARQMSGTVRENRRSRVEIVMPSRDLSRPENCRGVRARVPSSRTTQTSETAPEKSIVAPGELLWHACPSPVVVHDAGK